MAETQPTNEHWRPVPGYEGLYEVSDHGRVRSLDHRTVGKDGIERPYRGRVLKPRIQRYGHYKVVLYKGDSKKSEFVHRLVLMAHDRLPKDGEIACHKNDQPDDNRLTNLYWGTYSSNTYDRVRNGQDVNARKTHCPRGHEYTPETTRYDAKGSRSCKLCTYAVLVEEHAEKRAKGEFVEYYGGHCPQGHEYSPENTYWAPSGHRQCRECRRVRNRIADRRRREARRAKR